MDGKTVLIITMVWVLIIVLQLLSILLPVFLPGNQPLA